MGAVEGEFEKGTAEFGDADEGFACLGADEQNDDLELGRQNYAMAVLKPSDLNVCIGLLPTDEILLDYGVFDLNS